MSDSPSPPRPRMRLAASLLVIYTAAVGWTFHALASSWPHSGSWLYLPLIMLYPGIVFRTAELIYVWNARKPLSRRWLVRLVTVPAGVALGVTLSNLGSARAMTQFVEAYAPFVTEVAANPAAACAAGPALFGIAAVADYNRRTAGTRGTAAAATLHHRNARFVLALAGRSLDIDGSTAYYDSAPGLWQKFHNDDTDAQTGYRALTSGLAECALRA